MTMLGYAILAMLFAVELVEIMFSLLNSAHTKTLMNYPTPEVLRVYDRETFVKSAQYQLKRSKIGLFEKLTAIPVFYGLFISGGLADFTHWLNLVVPQETPRAIIFFLTYSLVFYVVSLPFSLYSTFVLEKEFGFNRTTVGTYLKDTIISGVISSVLLGVILAAVIMLIRFAGPLWWFYAALFISALSLFLTYIYPTFIAPLFNKFQLLEDGDLKERISDLAVRAKFPIKNIFVMDASRRTSHSNAYFAGLGKRRRIVLFDTLLKKHSTDEIVSILAHEIGHYKLGHIKKMLALSTISIFLGAYLLSAFIEQPLIYEAFGFDQSLYIGLFIISVLFSPISFLLTPVFSTLSRAHEYAADKFCIELTGGREFMISALIKLHRDNLSNPAPHPVYSRFYYTHPTLPERIKEIRTPDESY